MVGCLKMVKRENTQGGRLCSIRDYGGLCTFEIIEPERFIRSPCSIIEESIIHERDIDKHPSTTHRFWRF